MTKFFHLTLDSLITMTTDDASEPSFNEQLRSKVLGGLHTSEARNTDRYLGTAHSHAETLKAKGYPLNPVALKDLENTFATFHEEVLSQAIRLMTWGVAMDEGQTQTAALRACDKAFEAARGYAERVAEDEWLVRVTPAVASMLFPQGVSPQADLTALKDRLQARNQAADLGLRKQMFDAVMAVIYQRDLRQATVSNANAAHQTKELTAAMVRGTIVIAVATALQALQVMGVFAWMKDLLTRT